MSEFTIGRRQLYILPTRIGWYFSLVLLALFAIAIKFDNQAAFMMLFILVSVGLIAMMRTNSNVIGLEIESQPVKAIFGGETAIFPVHVINNTNQYRQALWLLCDGFHQSFDLAAGDQQSLLLRLPSLKRGFLNCGPVSLSSQFPLGLFFCWSKQFKNTQRCLVYPQPLDLIPLPLNDSQSAQQSSTSALQNSGEDYSGMKPYQAGDRPRDIHWPSLAKTQKLITIQHEDHSSSSLNLSWFSLPQTLSTEDKLSQLCYWVIEAEQQTCRYQLEMPNHTIQFSRGNHHYHECLSVLALWGNEERNDKQRSSKVRNNKKNKKVSTT